MKTDKRQMKRARAQNASVGESLHPKMIKNRPRVLVPISVATRPSTNSLMPQTCLDSLQYASYNHVKSPCGPELPYDMIDLLAWHAHEQFSATPGAIDAVCWSVVDAVNGNILSSHSISVNDFENIPRPNCTAEDECSAIIGPEKTICAECKRLDLATVIRKVSLR